jgi:Ca-activated chloride channel family protein
MAGAKTAVGDAIGLAINHFESSQMDEKVLILFSDGNDTTSKIGPVKAADIAKTKGIKIFSIGLGQKEATGDDFFDEVTMQEISRATGGTYSFVEDEAALQNSLKRINEQQSETIKKKSPQASLNVFHWPLLLAAFIFLLYLVRDSIRLYRSMQSSHKEGIEHV